MENKARYTLVGFFIFIFTIAMVGFILWLARYDVKELKAKEFRVYSKVSIAGLHKNSIVEYKGLDIGIIKEIRIDPKNLEQIEIILKITKPEIIKTNSYARIQSLGVTGNKIIEIDGGTADAKLLEAKDSSYAILPLKKSFLAKITTKAGDISEQINSILMKFEMLLSEENINNFNKILSNSNKTTENFNITLKKIDSLLDNEIHQTMTNLNKTVKEDLKASLNRFNALSSNISNLSLDVQNIINEDVKILLENLNETSESTKNVDEVLEQVNTTLEKIDTTIEDFEQNGGDMLFKTRETNFGPGEKQ